ncbi:hypothetical protein P3X46_030919 [Hevea brasiliensis]|uniref:Protein kinase domain-containing protein n=1 Tax=Hevea brasiliensis TaxID=3981 RepID=A0ABQ9KLJ8_HEVBR|nr:hypothetical protein P3X46_030919 [Hevea brasiliensis]
MFSLLKFICLCSVIFLINPIFSQQFYDKSNCTSQSLVQGSNYICSPNNSDCKTYVVYRAQKNFSSLSSIASLFNLSKSDLLDTNPFIEDDSRSLSLGREIIIPISCHCLGGFSQAIYMYNFSSTDSVSTVACGVFEGLVKTQTLVEKNPYLGGYEPDAYLINVPIRCACPDLKQHSKGVNYLVTYPIMEGDHTDLIARKFGKPEKLIWDANKLEPYDAIFPQTTLLVPTKDFPDVNWKIGSVPKNSSSPKAVIPLKKVVPGGTEKWNSHVFLGAGVCLALVTMVVACAVSIKIRRKVHPGSFQPLSARSSVSHKVSPDFLDGVSKLKHLLINYSLEEIRTATEEFNEASIISTNMYRGRIGGSYVAVEQMDYEEAARNVIDILTKINHLNIVRLEGLCHGSKPYLVFEFAENGSLWNCLSNIESDTQLTWARRLQIAFDLASALHYLHHSTSPAFVHHNINSRNVFITIDWRAKISGFSLAKPVTNGENKPDDLTNGQVSLKMDVFSFGIVLLELVSAKEVIAGGKILKDSVNFLLDRELVGSSQFLEKLREFMDPVLEGDYPFGDAICLTLLAKSCIEDDPDHRPTMNDILIALSRIV